MTRPISSFHFVGMFFLLLGHYVVVCGYDLKKKKIFYKNPSYDEGKHYTYVKTIKVFLSLTPPPPISKHSGLLSKRCYSFIIHYV